MVRWQLDKRRSGTRRTKGRSEISATTAKMYKQKGTGRARHAARTAPQFRGGGKAFGPLVRDHAIGLPKKVRAMALKHALSGKVRDDKLIVLADATVKQPKTKSLAAAFARSRSISPWPRATSSASTCCRCRASTSTTSCAATRWC
jgi:large subunit ribosomal protein L4